MIGDCIHPSFDASGVCTACKEFYSTEHDKDPKAIHPGIRRLMSQRGRCRCCDKPLAPDYGHVTCQECVDAGKLQ